MGIWLRSIFGSKKNKSVNRKLDWVEVGNESFGSNLQTTKNGRIGCVCVIMQIISYRSRIPTGAMYIVFVVQR